MLDFISENKGCVFVVAIIVFFVLYVVGRPGNFQSLISNSNDNLVITRVRVLDVMKVDPHDVNSTVENMGKKISEISRLDRKTAEDLVIEGPLVGEFRGGLAYLEVEGSQVEWLNPGDRLIVFSCSVYSYPAQARDCFEIPEEDVLFMDYAPNLRGAIDKKGKFISADLLSLGEDSEFEDLILVADVSLREAGFLDPDFSEE